MHISKRLREIRRLRGMTQAKVSDGITSASHYSNIECGRYIPPKETLSLLAERLSVPTAYLTAKSIDDKKTSEFLKQYGDLLEAGEMEKAKSFFQTRKKSFEYIPSFQQELHFNLLRCLDFFKDDDHNAFQIQYIYKIAPFVDQQSLPTLSSYIQEKYHYISALYHYSNGHYTDAIHCYLFMLGINENPSLHARLHFNIALAFFRLHHYDKALEYVQKSKDLHLNSHNWKMTAECYNLIAALYKVKNNFEAAEIYIHKGLNLLNDETEETYLKLLHNHALIYKEKGEYKKALEIIDTCIRLKIEFDPDDLFISYRAKLTILLELRDNSSIIPLIIAARNASKSKLDEIHLRVIEGKLYFQQSRFDDYENLTQQSVDYYLKHGHWKCLKNIAKELSEYYAERKQYKKAYKLNDLCILSITNMYKELL